MSTSSSSSSFAAGICCGAAAAAGATYYALRRKERALDKILERVDDAPVAARQNGRDESVIAEQFVRNRQFFGDEGQEKVRSKCVVVVGLGGVGSHTAVALARSGVEKLRLIDFDRVSVSSLNRHASALWKDVGVSKAQCLQKYIRDINPYCEVDAREVMFTADKAEELFAGADFVVDAIDHLPTKCDLLAFCALNEIPTICAGGAAAKADPTRIHITGMFDTREDELCKRVRDRLKQKGVSPDTYIPVVYSSERTERGLLPFKDHQEENPSEYQLVNGMRVRVLPVIAPMPAIFGNAIASFILCAFAEQPFVPQETAALSTKLYRRLFAVIRKRTRWTEQDVQRAIPKDVAMEMYCNVFKGKSAISQNQGGGVQLVPWKFEPAELDNVMDPALLRKENLVVLTSQEGQKHVGNIGDQIGGTEALNKKLYGVETAEQIDEILASLPKMDASGGTC